MKKFYTILASTAVVAASAFALVPAGQPGITPPQRAERQRTQPKARAAAQGPAKVMGGANGDKQLYGAATETGFSLPLYEWEGIAEIHANGKHVKVSPNQFNVMSGCYFNGWFMAFNYNESEGIGFAIYDAESWNVSTAGTFRHPATDILPFDLTYDPTTTRIYGCFMETSNRYGTTDEAHLCYIEADPSKLNVLSPTNLIGDMGVRMRGMASTKDGILYGVGEDNNLYTINKNNASITLVAPITWNSNSTEPESCGMRGYESAEIDWETGDMYFSMTDGLWDTFIFKIDTTTGQANCVADFGYETGGTEGCEVFSAIFFKQTAEAPAGTPAKVTSLEAEPVGVELKATVKFVMPAKTTDGDDLTGQLGYVVTDGENTLAEGTADAGAPVEATVTLPAEGFNNIAVHATAGTTAGAAEMTRVFVGCDTPCLLTLPDVYPDGNEAAIVWREAYAENGGNLAPLTYKVVRQPDGFVVAEATTETNATDRIDSNTKTRFTYEVTPISGTKAGETKTSRPTYLGTYFALPHSDTFDDQLLFNQYPALDANRDGNTWWIDTNANREAAVYSASSTLAADDYLCVGPFDLAAGSAYTFNMTAYGHNRVERVAAYVGTDPTSKASFKECIIEPTQINPMYGSSVLEGSFTPATSGTYYFAIHACSDANSTNLYIYDIKVSGVSAGMPAAPEVAFTPKAQGIDLTITLPSKTLAGDEAANLTAARIYRDNQFLAEVTDGVADGATITFTDLAEGVKDGSHSYGVSAVNAEGEGQHTTVNAYIGLDIPSAPRNMRAYEDLNTAGLIHVTWEAPAVGINGGYIDPSNVTYTVDWLSYGPVGSGAKHVGSALSFDLQIPAEALTTQDIIAFSVDAQNAAGTAGSQSRETRSAYFGPALDLPLRESFAGLKATSGIWSGESVKENEEIFESWWDYSDADAQDFDGCMMQLSTMVADGAYRLRTPRVDISKADKPVLVFYFKFTSAAAAFTVDIAVDDQPFTTLENVLPHTDAVAGKWIMCTLPLSDYKSAKYIQLAFTGRSSQPANSFISIDNINILDDVQKDLMVISFEGPVKGSVNETIDLPLYIRNAGNSPISAADYTVRLIKNGKELTTEPGWDIAPYETAPIPFTDAALPTDPEENVYTAIIDFADDENKSNNTSSAVTVRVVNTNYPAPTGLKAEDNQGVHLSWNEPDRTQMAGASVTDGFDHYQAFITDGIGEWKTYDGDGAPTVIMATILGPYDYPNIGKPMAWQVMDPGAANILAGAWYARSGEQFITSFQACRDGARDVYSNDWLISPELNGEAQTISFYARSGMNAYSPEIIDIYVSETGTEIDDFKILASDIEVPYASDWVEFLYKLPAGTKHFAIVHKSYEKLALLVDDITYIPAGSMPEEITLMGYHVYRDGVRITTIPVTETSYVDTKVETGKDYTYHVTAVWDKGESSVSEPATITVTSALVDVTLQAVRISTERNTIRIEGAEGLPVAVYNTAGMTVAATTGEALTEIPVSASGIYIVRAGQTVKKVIVR